MAADQRDALFPELWSIETLGLDRGRVVLERPGLFAERTHATAQSAPLALSPLTRLHTRARAGAVHDVGLDRLAPGRQLAEDGGLEIAVGGERERSRNRRGGHVQRVRH